MKLNWCTGVYCAAPCAGRPNFGLHFITLLVHPFLLVWSTRGALDQRSPTSCPSCPSPMEHSSVCMYLSAFLLDSLALHVHAVVLMLLQACTLFTMDYQAHHGSVAMYTLQKSIINGITLLLFIVVHTNYFVQTPLVWCMRRNRQLNVVIMVVQVSILFLSSFFNNIHHIILLYIYNVLEWWKIY